jgi:hypothetical protein
MIQRFGVCGVPYKYRVVRLERVFLSRAPLCQDATRDGDPCKAPSDYLFLLKVIPGAYLN